MRRRDFIVAFGGATACSLAAHAQQSATPVIGLVSAGALDETYTRYLAAWRASLAEIGYIEDQNISIQYHWLEGRFEARCRVLP
jgi:putative tryptophan/tyrosine transport system substrate-binding protein